MFQLRFDNLSQSMLYIFHKYNKATHTGRPLDPLSFLELSEAGDTFMNNSNKDPKKRLSHTQAKVENYRGPSDEQKSPPRPRNMKQWHTLVEERIQTAMQAGQFDNLSGHGKPLKLAKNPYADPSLELAHGLLKNNDYLPDWIERDIIIRREVEKAREQLRAAWQYYQPDLDRARTKENLPIVESLPKKQEFTRLGPNLEEASAKKDVSVFEDSPKKQEIHGLGPTPETQSGWQDAVSRFAEALAKINCKIDDYNLVVPILSKQRVHLRLEDELRQVKSH